MFTNVAGSIATTPALLTVNPPISFTPNTATLPVYKVGRAYRQTITTSGGTGDITITNVTLSHALPKGLRVIIKPGTVIIKGTPTKKVLPLTITITAKDQDGALATVVYTLSAK